MFSSVRVRLTLWYTGVLALALITFALAGYFSLSFTLHQRTEDALGEMANAFAATLAQEARESHAGEDDLANGDGQSKSDEAVIEAVRQNQFRDYQIVVFADGRRVVASSLQQIGKSPDWTPSQLAAGIDAVAHNAEGALYFDNLSDEDGHHRVVARRVRTRGTAYTLFVLRSLEAQEDLLETASSALFIAVPLALIVASVGGYFLARKSLAPVVKMSATAERISAANLHERLPIANERDELGSLARVINSLLARLDASFEQQRRFMTDASHELRTPIAIMRSETQVALSQKARSNQELRESLDIVNAETGRLARIVEDLFTLARADAGQYKLTMRNFYLDELASEVVRAVRTLAAERGLNLQLDATEEMLFHGDENLLRRLFLNLLDNAIKHTPRGGAVMISCRHAGEQFVITVSDTGTGIPAKAQPRIFDRFYRADSARSRAEDDGAALTDGAGLGLSISRWVAEAHGGCLELLSSSKNGSIFQLTLPATQEH